MLTLSQLIECELVRYGRRRAHGDEPSEDFVARVWTGTAWEDHTVAVRPAQRNGVDLSRSESPLPAVAALWRGR